MSKFGMIERAARSADAALRAKADELDALARSMDDKTAKPDGYHANSIAWFSDTAPRLREDATALRDLGRAILKESLT